MRIPDAYGGHRILERTVHEDLDDLEVVKVEGLSRADIENAWGAFASFKERLEKHQTEEPKRKSKVRTELYYQILGKKGKTQTAIPDNYTELGITRRQFKQKSKQK